MKTCEKCGFVGEFVTEEYGQESVTFCPDCHDSKWVGCNHEKVILAKYLVGESFRVQKLCSICFTLHGTFVKQSTLDMSKVKLINKSDHDSYQEKQLEKISKRRTWLFDLHSQWSKQQFLNEHSRYLNSVEWKEKRDEVLKRDNYLCQSCLKARATQVHHLNYKHWKNEPLFELISVCDQCHDLITRLDQNENLIA